MCVLVYYFTCMPGGLNAFVGNHFLISDQPWAYECKNNPLWLYVKHFILRDTLESDKDSQSLFLESSHFVGQKRDHIASHLKSSRLCLKANLTLILFWGTTLQCHHFTIRRPYLTLDLFCLMYHDSNTHATLFALKSTLPYGTDSIPLLKR